MHDEDCSETVKEYYLVNHFPFQTSLISPAEWVHWMRALRGGAVVEHPGPLHPAGLLQVRPLPRSRWPHPRDTTSKVWKAAGLALPQGLSPLSVLWSEMPRRR